MNNKNIPFFIKDKARLDISIRSFYPIKISENDCIYIKQKSLEEDLILLTVCFIKFINVKKHIMFTFG